MKSFSPKPKSIVRCQPPTASTVTFTPSTCTVAPGSEVPEPSTFARCTVMSRSGAAIFSVTDLRVNGACAGLDAAVAVCLSLLSGSPPNRAPRTISPAMPPSVHFNHLGICCGSFRGAARPVRWAAGRRLAGSDDPLIGQARPSVEDVFVGAHALCLDAAEPQTASLPD